MKRSEGREEKRGKGEMEHCRFQKRKREGNKKGIGDRESGMRPSEGASLFRSEEGLGRYYVRWMRRDGSTRRSEKKRGRTNMKKGGDRGEKVKRR